MCHSAWRRTTSWAFRKGTRGLVEGLLVGAAIQSLLLLSQAGVEASLEAFDLRPLPRFVLSDGDVGLRLVALDLDVGRGRLALDFDLCPARARATTRHRPGRQLTPR